MKRIIGLTTAALMGASVLAAPAIAQTDLDLSGEAETGVTTTMPDIDTDTTASINGSFDGALAAIGSTAMHAQSFETMTEVDTVEVLRIDQLEGTDPALIDDAVSQNQEGIEQLRASIESNAAVSSELEAQGVASSDVVGAEVHADGGVTVYVM